MHVPVIIIICIFHMELRNIKAGGVLMGKKKDFKSDASWNQSMIDNDRESRNSVTGYKETNPAEIAAAARVRATKHPDKTDM